MNFQFGAWIPDADPTTPNILTDESQNIVPSNRGYRGANDWSPVNAVESLTATCVGLWYARRTTQTNRLFAGTSQQLWERVSGSWVGRVPAAITVSAVDRWQFAQVGDITLAGALETQSLQFETTTATTIAQMPRYAIIDTVGGFVMIGNTINSLTYSNSINVITQLPETSPDRWWCSALEDYTTWSPSIARQSATGRLLDVPGPLTAGRQLGERFVFYKQRGMWLGEYEGPPYIWGWRLSSQEIGTYGQQCVVPVGYMHYFVGTDNFYVFDGAQPRPIGEGMREWFFSRLQKQFAYRMWGVHDEYNSIVYWWYPGPGSNGGLNEVVAFNYEVGKWGYAVITMQAAASYLVDELTYDQLWAGLTFNAIPNTTFDSAYFQANAFVPVFVNGDKKLATMLGPQLAGTQGISWQGDDNRVSKVRKVKPRWIQKPTSAIFTPSRIMDQGDPPQIGTAVPMINNRFHFLQSARWHRGVMETTGDWESPGLDADAVSNGRE